MTQSVGQATVLQVSTSMVAPHSLPPKARIVMTLRVRRV